MNQVFIKGKKVENGKVFYKLCEQDHQQWVAFNDIIEHLDLVLEFEKKANNGQLNKLQNNNQMIDQQQEAGEDQQQSQQISEENSSFQAIENQLNKSQSNDKSEISDENMKMSQVSSKIVELRLEKQIGDTLFFHALRRDGRRQVITNEELKNQDPITLINFYQKHILVTKRN